MAKILMVNIPDYGHVNPTIAIVKELTERGHKVSYLCSEAFKEKIENAGAEFIPYDTNIGFISTVASVAKYTPIIYENALRIGKDYDAVMYESMFFLGKKLADKLNKISIRLCAVFAINEKVVYSMYQNGASPKIFKYKWVRSAATRLILGKDLVKDNDIFTEISENIPDLSLVFTSKEFQIFNNEFEDDKFKFIGPSVNHYNIHKDSDFKFDKFQDKLIYISMGTLFNTSMELFKKCIEAFKDIDASIIISLGRKGADISKLGKLPSNVFVFDFVPQGEILKRAELFITHAGMNSANDAMYYEVPTIIIPQDIDQCIVGKRMGELGVGKVLNKKKISVELLRDTANQILNDSAYKNNLKKISMNMKKSGGSKRGVDEIEKLLVERCAMK